MPLVGHSHLLSLLIQSPLSSVPTCFLKGPNVEASVGYGAVSCRQAGRSQGWDLGG